ncbi:MAG: HAD-IIIA family hydrolase [Thermoplasmatota archaeon]
MSDPRLHITRNPKPATRSLASRAAILLDRDGVLNARRLPTVLSAARFEITPRAREGLATLARLDVPIVVVTNQEWVGYRLMNADALDAIHRKLIAEAERAGARIDAVYAATAPRWLHDSLSKPNPGMLQAVARDFALDPPACWMVGDNAKDIVAGQRFGARTVLVNARARTRMQGAAPEFFAEDLAEGARIIASEFAKP